MRTSGYSALQGVDGAKLELQEVVDFLKNPDKYTALGAKIPKVASSAVLYVTSVESYHCTHICRAVLLPNMLSCSIWQQAGLLCS